MSWYSGGPFSAAWDSRRPVHAVDRWLHMRGNRKLDAQTREAARSYQEQKGLTVDGQPGNETRRALVTDYMSLDGTTLPTSCALDSHGCGETHPDVPTGEYNTDEPT